MKKLWLILALSLALIQPITVHAATDFLDPNGDVKADMWIPEPVGEVPPYPTGIHYTAVDDGIRQDTEPDLTDYIYSIQSTDTEIYDMSTRLVSSVTNVTVWAYGKTDEYTSYVKANVLMGDWQTAADFGFTATNSWKSVSFNGTWTQANLDALQVSLLDSGDAWFDPTYIYAVYCAITYVSPEISIQVTLTPAEAVTAGAQWNLDGGEWYDSGEKIPTYGGNNSVGYKTIAGWICPSPNPETVYVFEDPTAISRAYTVRRAQIIMISEEWAPPVYFTYKSVYPPAQSDTYVKATSVAGAGNLPFMATDPTKPLIGNDSQNSWGCLSGTNTNQRFQIDLGSAKTTTRIYYENFHHTGDRSDRGAKTFTFWGSNTDAAFADTVWISDEDMVTEGWTQLTCSQATFDQHVALNKPDPKYIGVTNSTAFRYYCFKFVDSYGGYHMGVRRIELQVGN